MTTHIHREHPILEEINRLESERLELYMVEDLTKTQRARLAEIRDQLPLLWEKRRHEADPFYEGRDYEVAIETSLPNTSDSRRGPRLRTKLPRSEREAA